MKEKKNNETNEKNKKNLEKLTTKKSNSVTEDEYNERSMIV